jgi:hypothetical protein
VDIDPVGLLLGVYVVIGESGPYAQAPKTSSTVRVKTNRLIHESSPYLLQHATNPLDW